MFVLIEVVDQEISTPVFFKTEKEAYDTMAGRLCQVLDCSLEEVKAEVEAGTEGYLNLNSSVAWCERHGMHFDWAIFEVPETI